MNEAVITVGSIFISIGIGIIIYINYIEKYTKNPH